MMVSYSTRKQAKGFSCFQTLKGVNVLLLLAAFILLIMSAIVRNWWHPVENSFIGLWRTCINFHCRTRRDILHFKDHKDIDTVFASLLVSIFAALLTLSVSICRVMRSKCIMVLHLIFAAITECAVMATITWAIFKVDLDNQGWVFSAMYAVFGLVTCSLIFAVYAFFRKYPDYYIPPLEEELNLMSDDDINT